MRTFQSATFFIKPEERALALAKDLVDLLCEHDITPYVMESDNDMIFQATLEGATSCDKTSLPPHNNLGIVLGGDGTFLSAARCVFGHDIPVLGINLGRVGFLTETEHDDACSALKKVLKGDIMEEKRPFFTASILRDGAPYKNPQPFLNDAVLGRNADEKMVHFAVHVGNKFVSANRADGLIVSTPTGSTAYNLSTGGPIVYPTVDALILSPINPHTLSYRPVVVPPRHTTITLESPASHLSLDGRKTINLKQGDEIHIERVEETLTLLHAKERNFYDLLRRKLGWDLNV